MSTVMRTADVGDGESDSECDGDRGDNTDGDLCPHCCGTPDRELKIVKSLIQTQRDKTVEHTCAEGCFVKSSGEGQTGEDSSARSCGVLSPLLIGE